MSGLLDLFTVLPHLAELQIAELIPWAPTGVSQEVLDNYYGNRVLYSQAIAVDSKSAQLDLAILKAAVAREKGSYCNPNTKRLTIPLEIQQFVINPVQLAELFLDVCHPEQVTFVMTNQTTPVGTFIVPQITDNKGSIVVNVGGKNYKVNIGSMAHIPVAEGKVDLRFHSLGALLMGKSELQLEVPGGIIGIIVDARVKDK